MKLIEEYENIKRRSIISDVVIYQKLLDSKSKNHKKVGQK